MSCEINVNGARHSGIVLDVSASGLFIQTSVKPRAGTIVTLSLSVPSTTEPVLMEARVVRKKVVPPQLLTVAGGGVGLMITKPADAYLDFVAEMSPEHAEAAERARRAGRLAGSGPGGAQASHGDGGLRRALEKDAGAPKRFRVHAVEVASGRKNTFLITGETEKDASEQVLEQLGEEWNVLFIERV